MSFSVLFIVTITTTADKRYDIWTGSNVIFKGKEISNSTINIPW